jgi:hypothetical protein
MRSVERWLGAHSQNCAKVSRALRYESVTCDFAPIVRARSDLLAELRYRLVMDLIDWEVVGPIATYVAGVATTWWVTRQQQRHAAGVRREEREAADKIRREEREAAEQARRDERSHAELDALTKLYQRVAELGMEYREAEEVGGAAWQQFKPRFWQLKGELLLRGSRKVQATFREYMNQVQEHQHAADEVGYPIDEGFTHHDERMDKVIAAMQEDFQSRALLLETQRAPEQLPDSGTKQLSDTSTKRLPPGSDN